MEQGGPDDEDEADQRGSSLSPSTSSASPSPPPPPASAPASAPGGKKKAGENGGSKSKKQPPPAPTTAAKGKAANGILQSCYDREAEERLLRALGAGSATTTATAAAAGGPLVNGTSGGAGAGGLSLLDQLGPDDGLDDDDEGIDPALLREMELLKSSLEAKAEHREHLRSKLASQFERYCSSATGVGDSSGSGNGGAEKH
jgi:hypothetical protein